MKIAVNVTVALNIVRLGDHVIETWSRDHVIVTWHYLHHGGSFAANVTLNTVLQWQVVISGMLVLLPTGCNNIITAW